MAMAREAPQRMGAFRTGSPERVDRASAPSLVPVRTSKISTMASDAADRATSKGWIIIVLFFGLLGSWAVFAPLNSAVVAEAAKKQIIHAHIRRVLDQKRSA